MMRSRIRWGRACSTHGEKWNPYIVLVGKPGERRPLGRPRHRLENNIKMVARDITRGSMDCIDLVQSKDQRMPPVNKVIHLQVPQIFFWKSLSSCPTSGF